MRSDYLILLLLLSTASVAMMYLGSQSDTTYVYDTASNLQKRFRTKLEQTMPACCKALTKECLSCAAGMLVKDFCDRHRGEYGCTNVTVTPPPVVRSVPMKTGDSVKKWGNPNNWSQSEMFKYDAVANIINAFHRVGIDSFLTGGSALGAYRNHGWFSWDKDADLVVVSTDYDKIERALKSISLYFYESATHKNVTVDIPSDKGGFGYHVSIPQVGKHKTPYIDLWLFEKTKTKLQCKGFHNGCQRWCRKHSQKTCKPLSETLFYPPNYVPYGPYLMPTIRKPYLDFRYGNTWPLKCGYDKRSCSSRYNTDMFVFSSKDYKGNIIETAKIGEEVKHSFVIKNGKYTLLNNYEIQINDVIMKESSWRNCKELSKTENIHDVLFDQLKRFVSVINNTEYVIAYGTLLGVMRNNDMNPNEVDNDIIMEQTFRPTIELKGKLIRKGLIIFKHDIYRVCNYSPIKRRNAPPWVKYVPYIDIYNHLPNLKPFHAKPRVFKNRWNHSTMKMRDIYVKTPDLKTSKEWLSRTYKNWGTYVKKNTWKDRLLSKVKH